MHYLPLIEQKIGALDQAAPLRAGTPEAFQRRLLEARMGKAKRQVLRLLEFRSRVRSDALPRPIGLDAVRHLVLCRIERRPPRNLELSVSAARPGR